MIHDGKFFASSDRPFVLFMLGMRVHNIWNVPKWAQLYQLIPRMLEELKANPQLGCMGSISKISFREPLIIQYWESLEALQAFATNPKHSHLPVWKKFNQVVGKSKDIGIWHETYIIQPGQHENIYINMPFTGLGQVIPLQPISKKSQAYRQRFK